MTVIRIGHSPDPDDAFMFYALTAGKVKAEGLEIDRKSTRLNSSHIQKSRMPSSA